MEQPKEYYAFISYKREDEKWAKWLQDKLEHYKFPTNLNGRTDLPKNIRPTFRDVTDLNPGLLAEEINNALFNSEWLIVICSPRSAKSPWVCKEAQTFINLGRADHIIPFVIEGYPFSNDAATECYPEALLNLTGSKELLAANINEMGRDAAAIKVVARMFNLRFDVLWQRYEREQKRKRWMWIGGALLLAFTAMVIATIFVNLNKELKITIGDRDNALIIADSALTQVRKDSIVLAEHLKRIMNDSIMLALQRDSILQQKDEVAAERDNVKSANYAMQLNLSRILAKETSKLVDEGDSYLARLIALQALPPYMPYTAEAESALRKAYIGNNAILRGHSESVNLIAFSPNENLLASSSDDNTIRIWDLETGKLVGNPMEGHSGAITTIAFSKNGEYLFSGAHDRTIRIWDVKTHKQVGKSLNHEGRYSIVNTISVSPDGKYVVSGTDDGNVTIWDVEKRKVRKLMKHFRFIKSVSYSPNGKYIASAAYDNIDNTNTIIIWDAQTGVIIGSPIHSQYCKSINFSPDSKFIISASNNDICIWDVKTQKQMGTTLKGHSNAVSSVSYSTDGEHIVSASYDNTIRIWNARSGQTIRVLEGHTNIVNSVAFSPDGRFIASASDDNNIRLWEAEIKEPFVTVLKGHKNWVSSASFDPIGKHILSAGGGTVRIWDSEICVQIGQPINCNKIVHYAAFSPNGKYLAFAEVDSIRVYDVNSLKPVVGVHFVSHQSRTQFFSFSPDSKYLWVESGESGKHGDPIQFIQLWDIESRELIGVSNNILASIFKADLNPILIISNGQFVNRSLKIPIEVNKKISLPVGERFICLSIDGKYIVSTSVDYKSISVRNYKTGELICKPIEGHTGTINSVAFSPDGKYIVTASNDKTIKVWDTRSGLQVGTTLSGHLGRVNTASFSSDGEYIVSASTDSTIRIWEFPPLQELINETHERFKNRKLTQEERRKYYLE